MSYPDDEVMQKIYELRNSFYKEYRIKPNTVYIGHDEYYILKEYGRIYLNYDSKECKLFDMDVKRLLSDNHVSVGLAME